MTKEALLNEVDDILLKIKKVPTTRNYWLIRTQGGQYYSSFKDFNFVAIDHEAISLFDVNKVLESHGNNIFSALQKLKEISRIKYPNDRYGLIASQVLKFVAELKKGDIVVIPSENSETISIGEVSSSLIQELSDLEMQKTGCLYKKRKDVTWIKEVARDSIDPFMFRMFQAHQTINNITKYSDIIERTIGNFYIKDDVANLILDVDLESGINARSLFSLGLHLLDYSQDFFDNLGLELTSDEIQVKLNLNSKGKIQLKSLNPRTLWIIALLTIAVNGGGLKMNIKGFNFDLNTDGIVKKVIDYQNNQHDREKQDQLLLNMDSLKIKSPDDALKLYQQFSPNKNLPK